MSKLLINFSNEKARPLAEHLAAVINQSRGFVSDLESPALGLADLIPTSPSDYATPFDDGSHEDGRPLMNWQKILTLFEICKSVNQFIDSNPETIEGIRSATQLNRWMI